MFAVTEPYVAPFPIEPHAGNDVSCSFARAGLTTWIGTAKCKHGQTQSATHLYAPGAPPMDPTQMVMGAYRQHQLMVACDCPQAPSRLNATLAYGSSLDVQPGERRILAEQSVAFEPSSKKNFSYHGRLTSMTTGSFLIEARLQVGQTVATGARGAGQVFVAGTPAMLSAPLVDVNGIATSAPSGVVNLYPNQPLAFAFVNQGTTDQDVQIVSLKVSEVWIP